MILAIINRIVPWVATACLFVAAGLYAWRGGA